jgi:hypothetical protein
MKFALLEFSSADCGNEVNGLHVGESSWIVHLDEQYMNNTNFDFAEEVPVNWPGEVVRRKRAHKFTLPKSSVFKVCS